VAQCRQARCRTEALKDGNLVAGVDVCGEGVTGLVVEHDKLRVRLGHGELDPSGGDAVGYRLDAEHGCIFHVIGGGVDVIEHGSATEVVDGVADEV
jgi:L-ascorbate metabolism protein UlaG (beta-lactamase superfamily)